MPVTAQALAGLVDVDALARHLDVRLGGRVHISVAVHTAGYSNVTMYVTRGEAQYVLRRPPAGHLLPTAHDVLREFRFISALYGRARVPRPVLACDDPSVIGAPFYLMERVGGSEIRDDIPPAFDNPDGRSRIAEEMIDTLVELHAVDWQAAGLTGKAKGYIERQIDRWSSQWALTRPRTRDLSGLDEIAVWLRANMPPEQPPTVAHGDYKLDNVLFAPGEPKLLAVLDWELATIGDPLADLGWLLQSWGDTKELPALAAHGAAPPVTLLPGFPSIDELAGMYERKSGRSMRDLRFYLAFSMYRGAVIGEGIYMRYLEGNVTNPAGARMEWQVPMRIERIWRTIEGRAWRLSERRLGHPGHPF